MMKEKKGGYHGRKVSQESHPVPQQASRWPCGKRGGGDLGKRRSSTAGKLRGSHEIGRQASSDIHKPLDRSELEIPALQPHKLLRPPKLYLP